MDVITVKEDKVNVVTISKSAINVVTTKEDRVNVATIGVPGIPGEQGANGITPHIGINGNWYIGEVDTGIKAQGENGLPGSDGKEVELQKSSTHIQWKYVTEIDWINLVALADLKGADGSNGLDGDDGREVLLRVDSGFIQWQYAGDVSWTNLIEIATLKGDKGDKGDDGDAADIAAEIDAADAKAPLVDTDTFPLTEPTTLKKTLWSSIKSTLKTYFDGLYLALTGGTLTGDIVFNNSIGCSAKDTGGTISTVFTSWSDNNLYLGAVGGSFNSTVCRGRLNLIFAVGGGNTEYGRFASNGRLGILTTAPDKQLEINSPDGNCLRLTYNESDGSATYYVDFNVSDAGVLTINASGGIIKTANDIEITDATKGIILKSPDGSRFRITVDDDGSLITTEVA